eukprot:GFYU01003461.1.p2 GENE.GFYU01003461.1~~GFYU01003461.1.p2  ORF type:complete len:140 (+),score=24.76 GFYU01003461.1:879-1298(+)
MAPRAAVVATVLVCGGVQWMEWVVVDVCVNRFGDHWSCSDDVKWCQQEQNPDPQIVTPLRECICVLLVLHVVFAHACVCSRVRPAKRCIVFLEMCWRSKCIRQSCCWRKLTTNDVIEINSVCTESIVSTGDLGVITECY